MRRAAEGAAGALALSDPALKELEERRDESIALHVLAAKKLRALAEAAARAPPMAPAHAAAFPFLRVEAACLLPAALARLAWQGLAMAAAVKTADMD